MQQDIEALVSRSLSSSVHNNLRAIAMHFQMLQEALKQTVFHPKRWLVSPAKGQLTPYRAFLYLLIAEMVIRSYLQSTVLYNLHQVHHPYQWPLVFDPLLSRYLD